MDIGKLKRVARRSFIRLRRAVWERYLWFTNLLCGELLEYVSEKKHLRYLVIGGIYTALGVSILTAGTILGISLWIVLSVAILWNVIIYFKKGS